MIRDTVDEFIEQWRSERPSLDPSPLGAVSRILMLAKLFEQSADHALARFGLNLWQFDVLAALRRSGPPFTLSPSRLMDLVTLTSGAMTNRIDRLEQLDYVAREADPDDRRGVLITLTAAGRRLVDDAVVTRFEDARDNIESLSDPERKSLAALLRALLVQQSRASANRRSERRWGVTHATEQEGDSSTSQSSITDSNGRNPEP